MSRRRPNPIEVTNPRPSGLLAGLRRFILFSLWMGFLFGIAAAAGAYVHFAEDLPHLPSADQLEFEGVTTILADDGQVIGEFYAERRIQLPYERIPRTLILAFLATEDARFFSHEGLDMVGIARAAWSNFVAGGVVQGGSTITQQLAKSMIGSEKTLARKVREAIVARRMEDIYDKEQILLLYLNKIYLGHHSYGIQAAAQNYFRKNVWELTLPEMAMLAGLPQAPSALNPHRHPERARERRVTVLRRMAAKGFITPEQATAASEVTLETHALIDDFHDKTPGFIEDIRRELKQAGGQDWREKALRVETTANVAHTLLAQRAVDSGLRALDRQQGWRGPLAHVEDPDEQERFYARNMRWFAGDPEPGSLAAGIITAVGKRSLDVRITADLSGRIEKKHLDWAGPYTEFPTGADGKRKTGRSVSFRPRLQSVRETFHMGDIVLVEVQGDAPRPIGARVAARPDDPLPNALRLTQVPKVEGAFAALDLISGAVTTAVGSWDHDRSEVNRTRSRRQNGSTMKPIVYSKAYALGLPPSTVFSGAPYHSSAFSDTWTAGDEDYNPTGDKADKDNLVWNALVESQNNVSLRVLQYVLRHAPRAEWRAWCESLGLVGTFPGLHSEVLGTEQTLWEMVGAYSAFAHAGQRIRPRRIRRITSKRGRTLQRDLDIADPGNDTRDNLDALHDLPTRPSPPDISPQAAWMTGANLVEVNQRGTGKRARTLPFPTAGKTGTLSYDVWFVGWSPRHVAGAWVGSDRRERVLGRSRRKSGGATGSRSALPIWKKWMDGAYARSPGSDLLGTRPPGIRMALVSPQSGLLVGKGGQEIPHLDGTLPAVEELPEDAPLTRETDDLEF